MAQDLSVPAGAVATRDTLQNPGAYAMPVGPWTREGGLPIERIEGRVQVQGFRIDASGLTPLQLVLPLREQLQDQGFEPVLDCAARSCGGFDFRFSTFVLPAPQMAVDLTNYHFLTARAEDGSGVSILASRAGPSAYLQIIRAGRGGTTSGSVAKADAPRPAPVAVTGDLASALTGQGHVILPGLAFGSGSANLGEGPVASLDELAAFLAANAAARLVLVGHTDATGSLEGNVALSRKRAQAAVEYLVARHGIARDRISAEGAGYLSPVATNLTDAGREQNRRVEAVLLP